jgi:Zn-dependent protease
LTYGFLRSTTSHASFQQASPNSSDVGPHVRYRQSKPNASNLVQQVLSTIQTIEQIPWKLIQSRWSLGNPERFIKAVSGYTNLLYEPRAVTAWIYGFAIVFLLVLIQLAAQTDPLAWHPSRWVTSTPWLHLGNCIAILMITRVFHELGHAIVAARMGAKVRNVGIFWMLGVACPYVDVSDAWRLSSQGKRIFVSLAGIYTEMIIATIAGIVWLNTAPSILNTLCWQTMVICSAMTIVINMNPLVRYDGYFALSDYLEIANLREESATAVRNFFRSPTIHSDLNAGRRPVSGLMKTEPMALATGVDFATACSMAPEASAYGSGKTAISSPQPRSSYSLNLSNIGLVLFGLASSIYRVVLTSSFAVAAIGIGRAWELDTVGLAMAACLLVCSFILPLIRSLIGMLSRPSMMHARTAVSYGLLVALTGYATLIPLPSFLVCEGTVGWSDQKMVYTKEPGRLISVSPIQLENSRLRFQNQSAIEQLTKLDSKLEQARLAMFHDSSAGYPIEKLSLQTAIAKEAHSRIESQMSSMEVLTTSDKIDRTSLDPQDLEILEHNDWHPLELPPPEQIDATLESGFAKPALSEYGYSVQDECNLGRWLPAGTAVGVFIRGDRLRISATVDEETLSEIQTGTRVRVILAAYPTEVRCGRVVSISDIASLEVSQAFAKPNRSIPSSQTATETMGAFESQSFGILIELDEAASDDLSDKTYVDKSLFGSAASIVLETQARSLLDRFCRYAERVIR